MTHSQSPMQTRALIAQRLAEFLKTAKGAVHLVRTGIAIADGALTTSGFADDHRWLCEHYSRIRSDDLHGVTALANRLVERLTIEGDAVADDSGRAVDSLIGDTARHLASSGDRDAIFTHMLTLDIERLAHLVTDALVRLSDRDALLDELFQLRAQADIVQAKAPLSRCPKCHGLNGIHGLVHVRHSSGGGHNVRCPLAADNASAEAVQA